MFCVIVKTVGRMEDTMVAGPYESRKEAREAQRTMVTSLTNMGFKRENITTEVKEMVKM